MEGDIGPEAHQIRPHGQAGGGEGPMALVYLGWYVASSRSSGCLLNEWSGIWLEQKFDN